MPTTGLNDIMSSIDEEHTYQENSTEGREIRTEDLLIFERHDAVMKTSDEMK